ncbi:MAG: hypothetical protein FP825_04520 [Hyphomonas sp.]|uniref:hypothetical protein n=1 Tax=Hyphomonas sp. TaxID=87 RepID=UPI0017CD73F4|nr:hypothetical protein [Hyphomonas sp.]MBA3067732.1 hypothetical protein [Hyphomonas sp.]MBU3921984.1 hypothetical protein [Alphaproteobacteria bacterium]MBU4062180.1 hypothetical protein [Alphaproteobacteria bacterium]MBU4165615.1 hypothetical protein [Alphaproteobacteria bacterium]
MKTSGLIAALICGFGVSGVAMAQATDTISENAAVYMTFQSDADDVAGKPFKSASDLDAALNTLGAYNADQLTRGWMAYSALVASQDPEFSATVRDIEAFYGREPVMKSFAAGNAYARSLKGGDNAVGGAIAVTDEDLPKIYSNAAIIKEQGYSLQGYGWAKSRIRNGGQRAETVKVLQGKGKPADNLIVTALTGPAPLSDGTKASVINAAATATDVAGAVRLPAFLTTGFTGNRQKVKYGKEAVANQIASLAAMRIIGANSVDQTRLSKVMMEPAMQSCLKMQNLQLQGCVAGVGQEFELPHCISQHTLTEVADCLGSVYK